MNNNPFAPFVGPFTEDDGFIYDSNKDCYLGMSSYRDERSISNEMRERAQALCTVLNERWECVKPKCKECYGTGVIKYHHGLGVNEKPVTNPCPACSGQKEKS